jgi:hypothetical protein
MNRYLPDHLDSGDVMTPQGNAVEYGEAAEAFLNNPAVQSWIQDKTQELYEAFLELKPNEEIVKAADIIHAQNTISDLVAHMRYLKTQKETIMRKDGSWREETDYGNQDPINQEERERILGISGDPEG